MRIMALLGLMVVAHQALLGQGLPGARPPVYRGEVDVVALHVTVTDAMRQPVTDLTLDDFVVFEDSRPQEITFFQAERIPLDIALIMDSSASMARTLPIAQQAAIGFARTLSASDRATVLDFDDRVRVQQALTNDVQAVEHAIRQTTADGSTALHNAVYIGLRELTKKRIKERSADTRRAAVILLSDGEDTSSVITVEDLLTVATESGVAIYTIGWLGREKKTGRRWHEANYVFQQLARRTGGRAFFPKHADEFDTIYREIKTELSHQYLLAYASSNTRRDGQYRRIDVRVSRPNVVARTRAGYYAARR